MADIERECGTCKCRAFTCPKAKDMPWTHPVPSTRRATAESCKSYELKRQKKEKKGRS